MSRQLTPSPWKPGGQAPQMYDLLPRLLQGALGKHTEPVRHGHSFESKQGRQAVAPSE